VTLIGLSLSAVNIAKRLAGGYIADIYCANFVFSKLLGEYSILLPETLVSGFLRRHHLEP
jgi:hypothetical protein